MPSRGKNSHSKRETAPLTRNIFKNMHVCSHTVTGDSILATSPLNYTRPAAHFYTVFIGNAFTGVTHAKFGPFLK